MRTWTLDTEWDGSRLLRCDANAERDAGRPGRCVCYPLAEAQRILGKALWNLLAPLHGEGLAR